MKHLLGIVSVLLAFLAVSMMGGCAGQQGAQNFGPLTGNEGAAKESIDMGSIKDPGFAIGGSEGAAREGIDMGTFSVPGFAMSGSEGAARAGIKH